MHTYTVVITSGPTDTPKQTHITFASQRSATLTFANLIADECLKLSSDLINLELIDDSMGIVIGLYNA